ncbi:DUF2145 domain-containing protein [Aestuariibacter sp. GS-14]|uniref:DUF2145 domain-containing protein n=1 Tax=Aestuariibacter sp. GS-14 TaxID=2590670 RepID=UPI003513C435
MMRYIAILITSLTLLVSQPTFAGSQATGEAQFPAEDIVAFAKQVEQYAAEQQAYAFIIARQGRPEKDLPEGITFTHVAVAVYSNIELDNGEVVQGYAIHNLYQRAKDPGHSDIIVDYPVDFFWAAKAMKAGIIIPSPAIQQKLVALIASGKHLALHNPNYSVVANPHNRYRQNCTEYTLDVLQAAIYQTEDIDRIKENNSAYFTPQPVNMSRFKLAIGGMFSDGVTLNDHKGKVATATFGSLQRYMSKYGLSEQAVIMQSDGSITVL